MNAPQVPDQGTAMVDAGSLATRDYFIFFADLAAGLAAGGAFVGLWANGTIGIQSDAAPAVYLNQAINPVRAVVRVKQAGDSDIVGAIYAGAVLWASFTIPAGSLTSGDLTVGPGIKSNTEIRLAITSVATYPNFQGADLSAFIYY
jgi:hypothetical protein